MSSAGVAAHSVPSTGPPDSEGHREAEHSTVTSSGQSSSNPQHPSHPGRRIVPVLVAPCTKALLKVSRASTRSVKEYAEGHPPSASSAKAMTSPSEKPSKLPPSNSRSSAFTSDAPKSGLVRSNPTDNLAATKCPAREPPPEVGSVAEPGRTDAGPPFGMKASTAALEVKVYSNPPEQPMVNPSGKVESKLSSR